MLTLENMTRGPEPKLRWVALCTPILVVIFFIPLYFHQWFRFLLTTIILLALLRVAYRGPLLSFLGLTGSARQYLTSLVVSVAVATSTYFILHRVTADAGVSLVAFADLNWRGFIGHVTQVLNEEMICRAVLLTLLLKLIDEVNIVAIGVAAAIAIAHWFFYHSIGPVDLDVTALLSLFAFNLSCNYLFLKFRFLWYPIALHFGWNLVRFHYGYLPPASTQLLPEAATFNLTEGSTLVMAFALTITIATLYFAHQYGKMPKRRAAAPR